MKIVEDSTSSRERQQQFVARGGTVITKNKGLSFPRDCSCWLDVMSLIWSCRSCLAPLHPGSRIDIEWKSWVCNLLVRFVNIENLHRPVPVIQRYRFQLEYHHRQEGQIGVYNPTYRPLGESLIIEMVFKPWRYCYDRSSHRTLVILYSFRMVHEDRWHLNLRLPTLPTK